MIITMHLPLLLTGIELVSETTEEELQQAQGDVPTLTQGVTVAYTKPAATKVWRERERERKIAIQYYFIHDKISTWFKILRFLLFYFDRMIIQL